MIGRVVDEALRTKCILVIKKKPTELTNGYFLTWWMSATAWLDAYLVLDRKEVIF